MSILEIVFRVLVPGLGGALAAGAGITRIPWTPPNRKEGDYA